MNTEELPLPIPEAEVVQMIHGTHACQQIGEDGRHISGLFQGMTPQEVRADRAAYKASERAWGLRFLARLKEVTPTE